MPTIAISLASAVDAVFSLLPPTMLRQLHPREIAMVVPPMRFALTEFVRKGVWRKRLRPEDGATAPAETP